MPNKDINRLRVNVKVLHLVLKGEWFDMIAAGIKKEEYRGLGKYWATRLNKFHPSYQNCIIIFSHGYATDRRQMAVEWKAKSFGQGRPEWGAKPKTVYYKLLLGKVLEKNF